MEDKLVHAASIPEAHLGLGRVHVHVDDLRRQFKEQRKGRMAVVVQHVTIGFADGMREQLVAHEAAVDEQVLGIAPGPRAGRQARQAIQTQISGGFVEGAGGGGELRAHHRQHARLPVASRQAFRHPPVVDEREGHAGMRQGQPADHAFAMGIFGGRGLEELASGRGIDEQVAHLGHGALREDGRLRCANPAVERGGPPGMPSRCHPAGHLQARDGGDTGQGLAAKAQAGDPFQIVEAGDLAGCVTGQRQTQVVGGDAVAVIRDPDQADAALLQIDADVARAGIEAVLDHLLERRGGPLHHLARGDLRDQEVGQQADRRHGGILPARLTPHRATVRQRTADRTRPRQYTPACPNT